MTLVFVVHGEDCETSSQIVPRGEGWELSPKLIKNVKLLIETLKARDENIQNLMQLIDERFEKTLRFPSALIGIVHEYLWDREDLLNITSKVRANISVPFRVYRCL